MQNKKPHNVSEQALDNLLKQAFLNLDFNNPKNQELMETISNQVLPSQIVSNGLINKAFFTKLIGIIVIIATSAFIYFNYFKNNNNQPIKNSVTTIVTSSNTEQIIEVSKQEKVAVNTNNIIELKQEATTTVSVLGQKQEPTFNESPKHQAIVTNYVGDEKKVKSEDSNYVFPKLTEKEIKDNNREKLNMSMMLVKPNKYWYPLIGSKQSKPVYGNTNDTSAVFYIARSEVSNLEYRTFLFDLLIHDEKEAFLIAKPHQELWLNAPGHVKTKDMKDNYFSDKKYNDYPVVNITPEGAELYCKWLIKINKLEISQITARLPYENEWIKAARHSGVTPIYPWPGDSIQNRLGCFLANFCIQKQSEKLRPNHHIKCSGKNMNAYASAEFMLGDSMMTAKVYSYNPNDNGLYCMTGNVAEMVYDNKTKVVKTKGGSWNSDFEHCKLNISEELNGPIKANPMTGFRPVFRIQLKDNFGAVERDNPVTGITTLNPSEIKYLEKEKKTMIESTIKFNKNKYSYIPTGSCQYKNETISVQAFYMQTTEVTNLEYRAFLADLLIQNRPADYLLAKPNQQMWVTKFPYSFNEPMRDMYFWHPAYDEYPVLNISREAALMYCEWLTIESNKVLKASNKSLINDIRIPDEYEWVLAASNKKNYVKYANGNELLKDSKGKYDVNYMCFSKEQCKYDSTINLYVPKNEKRIEDAEKHQDIIDDGTFHTNQTYLYSPNSYGLYGMAGNVSEMIINHKTNQPQTKGGSWFSCDYFLQIDADDEYKNEIKASPLIGFRPVITAGIYKK